MRLFQNYPDQPSPGSPCSLRLTAACMSITLESHPFGSLGRFYEYISLVRNCHDACSKTNNAVLHPGIGFPGYLPASSGMGPAAPQWRPPVMPVSSEGVPASEGTPVMQPFPWLGAPFPNPGFVQAHGGSCTLIVTHTAHSKVCSKPLWQPARGRGHFTARGQMLLSLF